MFLPGNTEWKKAVGKNGRPKGIESPEKMFELFMQYVEEVDTKPWVKEDFRGKDATPVQIRHQRPYTWLGFENFLFVRGIINGLNDYKANSREAYNDYQPIIKRIDAIIVDQKMTGATIGFFSAALVGKELGLIDRKEIAATTTVISLGSGVDPEALPPADTNEYHEFEELL